MPDSNHKTVLMADDDSDCMLASLAFAETGAKAAAPHATRWFSLTNR